MRCTGDSVIKNTTLHTKEDRFQYIITPSRSRVWSEKEAIDKSAWEFADTERYLQAAEKLCGKYEWTEYDLLVLPPSFPYGGMENPCLTFVTPTLLVRNNSFIHREIQNLNEVNCLAPVSETDTSFSVQLVLPIVTRDGSSLPSRVTPGFWSRNDGEVNAISTIKYFHTFTHFYTYHFSA